MIQYCAENIVVPEFDRPAVEHWIRAVAAGYGFSIGQIQYIFCDDARMLEVNRQFLQHDYYTDHIGFDYSRGKVLNGDMYISVDTVRSNAEELGVSFENELLRILIHGILHLTGQEDKTPEGREEMTNKENKALELYESKS